MSTDVKWKRETVTEKREKKKAVRKSWTRWRTSGGLPFTFAVEKPRARARGKNKPERMKESKKGRRDRSEIILFGYSSFPFGADSLALQGKPFVHHHRQSRWKRNDCKKKQTTKMECDYSMARKPSPPCISLLVYNGFYWVLPSFTGFLLIFPVFYGFYWVIPSFTGFYWVFTDFYWFFYGFYGVLLSVTRFYWVLLVFF